MPRLRSRTSEPDLSALLTLALLVPQADLPPSLARAPAHPLAQGRLRPHPSTPSVVVSNSPEAVYNVWC